MSQWTSALSEISQFRTSGAESAIEDAHKQLRQMREAITEQADAVRQLEAAAQKAADAAQSTEQLKRCAQSAFTATVEHCRETIAYIYADVGVCLLTVASCII